VSVWVDQDVLPHRVDESEGCGFEFRLPFSAVDVRIIESLDHFLDPFDGFDGLRRTKDLNAG
jgi:hypothetical protein